MVDEAYCYHCKKDVVLVWDTQVEEVKPESVLVSISGRCPICMGRIRHIKEWLDG